MPPNLPTPSKNQVWSLNYHEVTRDPRVFKQARALDAGGYRVRVICDAYGDLPSEDQIDGIDVSRFHWGDYTTLAKSDLDLFDFAGDSFSYFRPEFETLVNAAEAIRGIVSAHAEQASELNDEKNLKRYYRDATGLTRENRKKAYQKRRMTRSALALVSSHHRRLRRALKQIERQHQIARRAFRNLHQGRAFVFAANAAKLELDGAPDVIHAHDIYTLPAGVILARRYGARLIYDAHELETARATNMGPNGVEAVEGLEARCFEHTDAIVTVSDSIADLYAQRFTKRAPIVVLNAPLIGMSVQQAIAGNLDVRSRAGLPKETPLLVYTGGVQREHRGLDKVVAALGRIPECHLVTLGPRHARDDAWLQEHAATAGMSDRLHMFDSVPSEQVVAAISTASAAIIPIQGVSLSYELAMPNKLFEAAMAKLPILVSDLPDMRKFVEALGIGIVMDHRSADGIEAAIRQFLQTPSSAWGSAASEDLLRTKYSWDAQVKLLLALYDDLAHDS